MDIEDLKTILDATKSVDGRSGIRITGHLNLLCEIFKSRSYQSGTFAVTLVRCIRNAVAGDTENANFIWESETVLCVAMLCREIAMFKGTFDGDDDRSCNQIVVGFDPQTKKQFVASMGQLISNFAACGAKFSSLLWSEGFGSDRFRDVIAAAQSAGSRPAVAAVVSTIYNTIHADLQTNRTPEPRGEEGSMSIISKFCRSKALLCQVFLSAIPPLTSIPDSGAASTCSGNEAAADPVLEWMHLLVFILARTGYLSDVFHTVRPRGKGESVWEDPAVVTGDGDGSDYRRQNNGEDTAPLQLSHEQTILLELVRDVFEDPGCTRDLETSPLFIPHNDHDDNDTDTATAATVKSSFLVTLAALLPVCQPVATTVAASSLSSSFEAGASSDSQAASIASTTSATVAPPTAVAAAAASTTASSSASSSTTVAMVSIPGVFDDGSPILLDTYPTALSILTVISGGLACVPRTAGEPLRASLASSACPLVGFCLQCLDARRRQIEARREETMRQRKRKEKANLTSTATTTTANTTAPGEDGGFQTTAAATLASTAVGNGSIDTASSTVIANPSSSSATATTTSDDGRIHHTTMCSTCSSKNNNTTTSSGSHVITQQQQHTDRPAATAVTTGAAPMSSTLALDDGADGKADGKRNKADGKSTDSSSSSNSMKPSPPLTIGDSNRKHDNSYSYDNDEIPSEEAETDYRYYRSKQQQQQLPLVSGPTTTTSSRNTIVSEEVVGVAEGRDDNEDDDEEEGSDEEEEEDDDNRVLESKRAAVTREETHQQPSSYYTTGNTITERAFFPNDDTDTVPPPAVTVTLSPEIADASKELLKAALQVLGNLTYGCKVAQDMLRDRGGIPLILSHCGTDFENPLAREWALLCIRNACEGNEENQRYIDSLKPQEVVQDDETLRKHGLSMEVDPQTGKFTLNQTVDHLSVRRESHSSEG